MSISANTVWEVRTTGSDSNGGGFTSGASGTDYSQQDSAQYSGTDLVVDATTNTKVTSASHSFVAVDVGNILRITAGAGWTASVYQIVSVTSGAATLDRSPAVANTTGGSYVVGGALASLGLLGSFPTWNSNIVYIKAGTYSITSASSNVSGGCYNGGAATICGYSTNRTLTNLDGQPTLRLNVSTATIAVSTCYWRNLILDGNAQTSAKLQSNGGVFEHCAINNFRSTPNGGVYHACSFTGWTVAVLTNGSAFGCEAYNNTATPFGGSLNQSVFCVNCISRSNTGGSTDGFLVNGQNTAINCIAYSNGRHGFNLSSGGTNIAINCHAEANAGNGFAGANASGLGLTFLQNCSAYNNTSGATSGSVSTPNFITITAGSVFTNAAGGDFSLNNLANQGALLRAAGLGTFPVSTMLSYPDIGPVQHKDPSVISLSRMFAGF